VLEPADPIRCSHAQDLPEQFEDSIADWMGQFHFLLSYENAAVTVAAAAKDADAEVRARASVKFPGSRGG
jgi:hypothetical protein